MINVLLGGFIVKIFENYHFLSSSPSSELRYRLFAPWLHEFLISFLGWSHFFKLFQESNFFLLGGFFKKLYFFKSIVLDFLYFIHLQTTSKIVSKCSVEINNIFRNLSTFKLLRLYVINKSYCTFNIDFLDLHFEIVPYTVKSRANLFVIKKKLFQFRLLLWNRDIIFPKTNFQISIENGKASVNIWSAAKLKFNLIKNDYFITFIFNIHKFELNYLLFHELRASVCLQHFPGSLDFRIILLP